MKKHAQRDILQKVIRAVAIVNQHLCALLDYMCMFASGPSDGGSWAVLQRGCVCVCACVLGWRVGGVGS